MSDAASNARNPLDPHSGPAAPADRLSDEALHRVHTQLWREKEEPREGFSLVPIFLIFLAAALTLWGGIYMANNSGGFRSTVFDDIGHEGESGGPEADSPEAQLKRGKKIFTSAAGCQACHGPEGKGQPGLFPPIAGSPFVGSGNGDRPIKILLAGLGGDLDVLGGHYNGQMPAIGQSLKDKEIADVLTYVRVTFNNAAPVDADQVAAMRDVVGKRPPWTPGELLAQDPLGAMPAPAAPAGEGAPAAPAAPAAAPGAAAAPAATTPAPAAK